MKIILPFIRLTVVDHNRWCWFAQQGNATSHWFFVPIIEKSYVCWCIVIVIGWTTRSRKEIGFAQRASIDFKRLAQSMILISYLSFVLYIWFPSYSFQLTTVSIEDLKSEYVTPILKVLGSELVKLTFLYGSELIIQDLALCPKLEELQILPWSFFQLLDSGEIDPLNPATFLSQLRVFQSNFCLGKWSHLFENKSSLVSLSLHCCHIGCLKDGFGSSDRPRKRFKSASEVRNAQS